MHFFYCTSNISEMICRRDVNVGMLKLFYVSMLWLPQENFIPCFSSSNDSQLFISYNHIGFVHPLVNWKILILMISHMPYFIFLNNGNNNGKNVFNVVEPWISCLMIWPPVSEELLKVRIWLHFRFTITTAV